MFETLEEPHGSGGGGNVMVISQAPRRLCVRTYIHTRVCDAPVSLVLLLVAGPLGQKVLKCGHPKSYIQENRHCHYKLSTNFGRNKAICNGFFLLLRWANKFESHLRILSLLTFNDAHHHIGLGVVFLWINICSARRAKTRKLASVQAGSVVSCEPHVFVARSRKKRWDFFSYMVHTKQYVY